MAPISQSFRCLLSALVFGISACAPATLSSPISTGAPTAILIPTLAATVTATLSSSPLPSLNREEAGKRVVPPTPTRIPSAVTPVPIVARKPTQVVIAARATKISQLIGDFDKERNQPTANLTNQHYKLISTDLGVPFRHKDRTYILFGDTNGAHEGDAIAYTTDTHPEDGLSLQFVTDAEGVYKPVTIPGISQGGFEVPMEGVSVNNRMYVYHTTDSQVATGGEVMGRSVVAFSDDDGQTFKYLYDVSRQYFINISIVEQDGGLMMFGSGKYRHSNVYLAYQPAADINTRSSIWYYTGLDGASQPKWSQREQDSRALFDQPCVGEFSVSYNRFINKWIMLYNCAQPRGILLRTADQPWGPWSDTQILFDPWADNGYCHFMHTIPSFRQCDSVNDPGQENTWGGEYGPYQFEDFAIGTDNTTTIYFTMSTWNPYTVVLMKATLRTE